MDWTTVAKLEAWAVMVVASSFPVSAGSILKGLKPVKPSLCFLSFKNRVNPMDLAFWPVCGFGQSEHRSAHAALGATTVMPAD